MELKDIVVLTDIVALDIANGTFKLNRIYPGVVETVDMGVIVREVPGPVTLTVFGFMNHEENLESASFWIIQKLTLTKRGFTGVA